MHIPKTYLSLHDVTGLQARVDRAYGAPLVLTIDSAYGAMQISFYLQPLLTEDQIEALATAIGKAMTKAEPAAIPSTLTPEEKAAYAAADGYWERLKLDLNRHPIGKAAE
jgi:hypothetical protein